MISFTKMDVKTVNSWIWRRVERGYDIVAHIHEQARVIFWFT